MSEIRLDTFIDPALVRKVSGIVRDMLKDKGFQSAEVTPEIVTMEGGPKLVHLTFHMSEGPKVKIKRIEFVGNKVIDDATLKKKMKENTRGLDVLVDQRPRRVSGTQVRRGCRQDHRVLPRSRLHPGERRRPRAEVPQRLRRQEDALDRAADSDHGRPPIQGRRGRLHGQHDRQDRVPEAAVQAATPARSTTRRTCARAWKRRARSTAAAVIGSSRAFPTTSSTTTPIRPSRRRPRRSPRRSNRVRPWST